MYERCKAQYSDIDVSIAKVLVSVSNSSSHSTSSHSHYLEIYIGLTSQNKIRY